MKFGFKILYVKETKITSEHEFKCVIFDGLGHVSFIQIKKQIEENTNSQLRIQSRVPYQRYLNIQYSKGSLFIYLFIYFHCRPCEYQPILIKPIKTLIQTNKNIEIIKKNIFQFTCKNFQTI